MEYVIAILLLLIVHPYTTYPIILLLLNKMISKTEISLRKVGQEEYEPMVSVLIAAYNEEKVIAEKLKNSIDLDYPHDKLQIVVGSDGSQDKTNDIVRDFAKLYSNVRLLDFPDRSGKVNVINKSIMHCKGDVVVLSDANAMYNKEAIKNIIRHFKDPYVGCVAGEKRMVIAGAKDRIGHNEGLYWKLESFIKRQESQLATVIGADGALYAIRKNLFQALPRDTSVDDFLLSMLIVLQGYKIEYEPDAYSYEESGDALLVELRRKTRIAAGNYYNLKYLKRLFSWNLISFMFLSHKLLRWFSPFVFIVLTILLLGLSSGKVIYLAGFFLLIASYIIAMLGYRLHGALFYRFRVVSLLTYFYLTVLAQLQGFIKYLKGSQKATWDTVRQ